MKKSKKNKKFALNSSPKRDFEKLYKILKILRGKNGCPWDREQTPLSLRSDLIEETFEACDAISTNDFNHIREELGDVILNATMISLMFEERGNFLVKEVLRDLCEKLVRRHPHVFKKSNGSAELKNPVKNSAEVLNQWDRIKKNVEGRVEKSILDSVPKGFPPILKSYKMQKKVAKLGFDWENSSGALEKIYEELHECEDARKNLEAECQKIYQKTQIKFSPFEIPKNFDAKNEEDLKNAQNAKLKLEEEIGDAFFSLINYARLLKIDPECALNRANQKFFRRFTFVEQKMNENEIPFDSEHFSAAETFWNNAKRQE